MSKKEKQCYSECNSEETEFMFECTGCKKLFHQECLQVRPETTLAGDVFFTFTCSECSQYGVEICTRYRLQWLQVLLLTLYNLNLRESGRHGFFRWKQICSFIEQNWQTFFGPHLRKRSSSWYGSVSGVLSSYCPQYFTSGQADLKETGWWKLKDGKMPKLDPSVIKLQPKKVKSPVQKKQTVAQTEGLRSRHGKTSIQSAMELKQKRDITRETKDIRKRTRSSTSTSAEAGEVTDTVTRRPSIGTRKSTKKGNPRTGIQVKEEQMKIEQETEVQKDTSAMETDRTEHLNIKAEEIFLMEENDIESDIEIDPGMTELHDVDQMPDVCDLVARLPAAAEKAHDSSQLNSDESSEDQRSEDSSDSEQDMNTKSSNALLPDGGQEELIEPEETKFDPLTVYEERQLLNRLNHAYDHSKLEPHLNRLRQKLKVRQIKRERGLPIFNLDAFVNFNKDPHSPPRSLLQGNDVIQSRYTRTDFRVLDRFQTSSHDIRLYQQNCASFLNRLVGTDDDHIQSIISPYSERILKPFIRRDYESISLKMKLYKEILAYPHRNNPTWSCPTLSPIDYSYARPQHIASVNALCREFFWPGIDLSECLQYPDFSCIAMYRHIVIGFAFMVPDVKYNEAYISFIFTHPEWRNCGIGTFMLYHLIQTCMGKDVTLHVSATNSAMLMYQKFGFKCEEYIIDFYDKYFPSDSKECKHAFFLRLKR